VPADLGGDGYMTEGDGNQTFMFSFGPLSGLQKIRNGLPGTDFPDEFRQPYCEGGGYLNGQPNPYSGHCQPERRGGLRAAGGVPGGQRQAVVGQINSTTCTVASRRKPARCTASSSTIRAPGTARRRA